MGRPTLNLEDVSDPERRRRRAAEKRTMQGAQVTIRHYIRHSLKRMLIIGAILVLLGVAWRFMPFTPEELLAHAQIVRDLPLAPLWVAVAFVLLGMVMFPFMALRLGTVLVFGPILGPIYALLAGILSAFVGYSIGRRLGIGAFEQSPRAERIRARLANRGLLAVAALRLVPLGPFTLVNALAGAANVRRRDFILGTALGTAPGLIVLALAGAQLARLV